MSDEHNKHDELQRGWPEDIVVGQEGAVRVFWLQASDMQGLVSRLALVLSEHMIDTDELHVTYNAMQSGWQEHPPRNGSVLRAPEPGWTELGFEYSAFVILRGARQ
ncbi:MAG: hypothetical protein LC790_00160 [Actinobacteria bacterium]|nr:hypothetical protein [Actinomycetota bacterium]